MNYHLMIDHWFLDDFISTAEQIAPSQNKYILTFTAPSKNIKSPLGIFAPYGSQILNEIVFGIQEHDKVYVHWFHEPVMTVVEKLKPSVKVFLIFWGGDFMNNTKKFFAFNYDHLTKNYLQSDKKNGWLNADSVLKLKKALLQLFKTGRTQFSSDQRGYRLRKKFMKRLDFFCHWNEMDLQVVAENYGGSPKFLHFFYGGGLDLIPWPKFPPHNETVKIWLGNSDTPANNHLDAIEALARFKNCRLEITCALSYGLDKRYAECVTKSGTATFGDKWTSLLQFMPLSEYLQLQEESDVVIMYHNRSQASGNVIAFLKMGKKIFLKRQSSLYSLLKRSGILIFDANAISSLDFEEFSRPLSNEEKMLNAQLITKLFSEEDKMKGFKRILENSELCL
jgi:dTDP-N-acetylfucosamine:lipid II N-acetylfucosaminyltransferase